MKALAVVAKENLALVDIPKPVPRDDEVLIKVAYCGICGSDMPRYFQGSVHTFPQVLGHEFSGTIAEVGEKVKTLHEGERVVAAPLAPCRNCAACHEGRYSMCTGYGFIGSRQNGALAEFVTVNQRNIVRIPDSLPLKTAALLEPLAVAIHSVERLAFRAGATALVYGAGTIGLLTIVSAHARGAGTIIVADIDDHKLALARKLGADITINTRKKPLREQTLRHRKPLVVFETAGQAQTQKEAVNIVDKKGGIVFVGTCTQDVNFPAEEFEKILREELVITGSWMGYSAPFPGYEWQTGLDYLADDTIAASLITHVYRLEDKEKPFEDMRDPAEKTVKVMYRVDPQQN